jgi:hypothetical protein
MGLQTWSVSAVISHTSVGGKEHKVALPVG